MGCDGMGGWGGAKLMRSDPRYYHIFGYGSMIPPKEVG